jgi:hypothetical protein
MIEVSEITGPPPYMFLYKILLFSLLSLLLLLLAVLVTCAVFSSRSYFLVLIAFLIFSFAPSFSVKFNLRCHSGSSVLICIFLYIFVSYIF